MSVDKILSEVYAVVMAMGEYWKNRIPADVWNDILQKKNADYTPYVDPSKQLLEQGLADDTITFIAMLHRDYWCDSAEEQNHLIAVFKQNEEKWNAQLAGAGSTRALLKMIHKN